MPRLETGGILVGYVSGSPVEYVITDVVGPGPRAVHLPFAFVPDAAFHEQQVARIYAGSGRTRVYLGDWHTHPRGSDLPSGLDKWTLRRIGSSAGARMGAPLMAILAGASDWTVGIWCARGHCVVRGQLLQVYSGRL